jgi:hypothetical protein
VLAFADACPPISAAREHLKQISGVVETRLQHLDVMLLSPHRLLWSQTGDTQMSMKPVTLLSAVFAGALSTHASSQEIFGAKFTHQLTPPEFCSVKKGKICSWTLMEAQGNAGQETAPRDGRIAKLRLVACAPRGSFVLQIVRVKPGTEKAKAVRTGPVINYSGTSRNCNASKNFDIEEFAVDVPVSKGDSLAAIATEVRFMYNPGSGPSIMFDPPLAEGDAFRSTTLASGFLMLQAELAP